jgi:hypothetical protein
VVNVGVNSTPYDDIIDGFTTDFIMAEQFDQVDRDPNPFVCLGAGVPVKLRVDVASNATSETWAAQLLLNEFDA